MAKSDSFFIRASMAAGTAYDQISIDLGSFVDALGKTVLRIHNVSVEYGLPPAALIFAQSGGETNAFWQLTTQSQGGMVNTDNRSIISSGSLRGLSDTQGNPTGVVESSNLNPETWAGGYLVAVESIFMATDCDAVLTNNVSIVLECTVETMTQAASMALALSQQ